MRFSPPRLDVFRNTLRYIDSAYHVFKCKLNEYITRVTTDIKGARTLLEAGFEYVMQEDKIMLLRKRKMTCYKLKNHLR